MNLLKKIRDLNMILSHESGIQFIYFIYGLTNDNDWISCFQDESKDFVIGKILQNSRVEVFRYLEYLLCINDEEDNILKYQGDILVIKKIHDVLNGEKRNNFINFICGLYNNSNWRDEYANYGETFIIGKIMDAQKIEIITYCNFLLSQNTDMDFQERGEEN